MYIHLYMLPQRNNKEGAKEGPNKTPKNGSQMFSRTDRSYWISAKSFKGESFWHVILQQSLLSLMELCFY